MSADQAADDMAIERDAASTPHSDTLRQTGGGTAASKPTARKAGLVAGLRRWGAWIRVAISIGLIYVVLQQTSLGEVGAVLGSTLERWPYLAVAALLPILGTLFAALRWWVLLGGLGATPGIRALYGAILVGSFFNYFLPSTIGGDVARSWWIQRTLGSGVLSLTVVGVDRLVGLVGICAVGLIAAAFQPSLVGGLPHIWVVTAVIILGLAALAALHHPAAAVLGRWAFSLPVLRLVRDKAATAYKGLVSLRHAKWRLVAGFVFSIGLQVMIVLQFFAFSSALGSEISLAGVAVLVPVVTLVTLLPLTINGIGLRETALAVLGAAFGLTVEDAIAMAWLFLGVHLLYAVIGGLIFMLGRAQRQ